MSPRYFDIHSHLNFKQFDADRDRVIADMERLGIGTILVGTNETTSQESIDLATKHKHFYATVGTHPCDYDQGLTHVQKQLAGRDEVVAIGECGIDYFHEHTVDSERAQKQLFEAHIDLALEHDLPLMIHMRPSSGSMDAYHDGLDILEARAQTVGEKLRGNSHFFVGDEDVARRFLDLGFSCSFDGPITFTREYDDVVRFMPSDMIHAETDAPFAAPKSNRGKRNEPPFVIEIIEALASIRGEEIDGFVEELRENANRMFGI